VKICEICVATLCRREACFLLGKYFGKIKNGQKKCPKTDLPKYFAQSTCFVSISEIYGVVTEKVIFVL
jgi:hypothetical protein